MKNVLLINTSGDVAARLLQQDEQVNLSVITPPEYRYLYDAYTDVTLVGSVEDLTEVRLAALMIRRRNPFDFVVTPSEAGVQAGGYVRSYFGLAGPGYDVVNGFSNKHVMKQRLRASGVPVARFRQLAGLAEAADAARTLGWPLVVKPVIGGGSEDVFAIRDAAELAALADAHRSASLRRSPYPLLAEEFVDIATEYHCDGVVVGGEVRFVAVSEYFAPVLRSVGCLVGSSTLPDGAPEAAAVADLHGAAVKALGLRDGVTHLEVLRSADGYLVGEIACRPGGGGITQMLLHQYGVDLWEEFVATSTAGRAGCAARPAGDFLLQYLLPWPTGVVERVSTEAELREVPGVVHAEVYVRPGMRCEGVVHSAVHAGLVLLRAGTREQARERIAALGRRYEIVVAPREQR